MFKELKDNLATIEREILKFKTAVAHIEESKESATKAVKAAETINEGFKVHLQKVIEEVDSILKPQKTSIGELEKLLKVFSEIDFPARLDKQQKELKILKIVVIMAVSVSFIDALLIILLKIIH